MGSKWISLLLFCALTAGSAWSQSLGAIAKKERERREKNKAEGVAAREFSETEVFGKDPEPSEGESDEDVESEEPAKKSPIPARIDIPVEGSESKEIEDESRDRKREETEWRGRFHQARERVKAAREQKRVLDGLHYVPGITFVDENGNVVIESLDHLRRLVAEADRELREAEEALKDLEEEARRAGVPPGWLR